MANPDIRLHLHQVTTLRKQGRKHPQARGYLAPDAVRGEPITYSTLVEVTDLNQPGVAKEAIDAEICCQTESGLAAACLR